MWCGSAKPPIAGPRDGSFARTIPAVAAGIVAIGTNSFRRTGRAVACAVSAVVRLCGTGPDLEKQLAQLRQAAGGDQADGSRRGERTYPLDFDGGAGSCPVACAKAIARSRTAAATENPMLRRSSKLASKFARKFARKFTSRKRRDSAGRLAVTRKLRHAAATPSERGFVIVAVLWILAALSALATIFSVYLSNSAQALARQRYRTAGGGPGVGQSRTHDLSVAAGG